MRVNLKPYDNINLKPYNKINLILQIKNLCLTYAEMHGEMEEYNTVKENLQSAADALGIENASLKEVREAIKEK